MSGLDDMFSQLDRQQASEAPSQFPAAPQDKPASMFDILDRDSKLRATSNLADAQSISPDTAAEALKTSKALGIPVPAVEENLDEARQSVQLQDNVSKLDNSPKVTTFLADNPLAARMVQDDLDNLTAMEKLWGAAKDVAKYAVSAPGAPGGGILRDVEKGGRAVASGVPQAGAALYGVAGAFGGLADQIAQAMDDAAAMITGTQRRQILGTAGPESFFLDKQKQAQQTAAAWMGLDPKAGFAERAVLSGLQSAGQTLLTMPLGFAATAKVTGETMMLGTMGLMTAGQSYGKGREAGLNPTQAIMYATQDALAEMVTERYLGAAGLLRGFKAGAPAAKLFAYEIIKEVPGEMAATLWQNFNEWANVNPDKSIAEFIDEQPAAMRDTIIATLAGGTAQIGSLKLIEKAMSPAAREAMKAEQANVSAVMMTELDRLTEASKLRERDHESFNAFVKQLAQDGPVKDLFISGDALMQSGINMQELAALIPSMGDQFQSVMAGKDLTIPVEEYMTSLAGTDIGKALIPHLKTDVNGMSQTEAKAATEQAGEFIKTEADRVLKQAQDQVAWQQSVDTVKNTVLQQLNATGRQTEGANEIQATLTSHLFATMAARTGMTPEQMYQRYPLRVTGVMPGQGAVDLVAQEEKNAAEAAGFDSTTTWLHGTTKNFKGFKVGKGGVNELGPGVYFTKSPMYADTWSGGGRVDGGRTVPAFIKRGEFFDRSKPVDYLALAQRVKAQNPVTDAERQAKAIRDTKGVTEWTEEEQRIVNAADTELWRSWLQTSDEELAGQIKRGELNTWLDRAGYIGATNSNSQVPDQVVVFRPENIRSPFAKFNPKKAGSADLLAQGDQPFQGISRDQWLGDPKITKDSNARDLKPSAIRSLDGAETAEPFMDGKYTAKFSPNGSAVFDGDKVIASYDFGDTLVVDKKYRRQGIAEELVYQWRTRYPAPAKATTRTKASQAIQEKVWERIQREQGALNQSARQISVDVAWAAKDRDRTADPSSTNLAELKADIEKNGIQKPITITVDTTTNTGYVTDGNNRLAAARELGLADVPYTVETTNVPFTEEQAAKARPVEELGITPEELAPKQKSKAAQEAEDWLKAFNAGELNQSVDQTETPAFKKWFGDSKVVDAQGKPLVVYHGTRSDITTFEPSRGGEYGSGIYMTADEGAAWGYANRADGEAGENVMPVYVRISNPYMATSRDKVRAMGVKKLKSLGHDGIISVGQTGEKQFIAFTPEQIKSATGNRGTFDPNDPSILAQGPRATFSPSQLLITLGENSNLTSFVHELGHFALQVMADISTQSNAPQQIVDDMNKLLGWFGVQDIATWNAMTLDQKRQYHEKLAESFEQYALEGKAPSQELKPVFRRLRSWFLRAYTSITAFMTGRNLQLNDEIRQVFDRMLATDEQIRQAEEAAGMLPDFDATNDAIEKLQEKSLRDLKWTLNARSKAMKNLTKQAKALRSEVMAEVRAEVDQMQEMKADTAIKEFKKTNDRVPNDLEMAMIAEASGYETADAMLQAIDAFGKKQDVIDSLTDQRMLEKYGEFATPEAIEEAATEAVHNEARARALATELKAQSDAMNPRKQTGTDVKGRPLTVNALVSAARQFAQDLTARRKVKDLKNATYQHLAAERRAAKKWQEATAKGETQEALQAKRDQLLNNYTAKAMQEAQEEVKKITEFFRKITKGSNEKIVKGGRDADVVNAMRAVLAAYDIAPRLEKGALEYMEAVSRNDPAMYNALAPGVQTAISTAKPLEQMTMEELRGLHDEMRSMWDLAKRSRQMEVDGNLMDIEDAAGELVARMQAIGIPETVPGEKGSITPGEEAGIKLQFAKAILSRVEQWAERMDGKFGGPFLKLVFQPIKEAADRYRADRVTYRKEYTELVKKVGPFLSPGPVAAPELGYTFGNARDSGMAEIQHAILHTGNESNMRKLLLGRGWATENPDGTVDTRRWESFIDRLKAEGKLKAEHYEFAQGVWDLLEKTKPLAQKTHREVFGRYFDEVTADSFTDPFGNVRRGGYVPAQTDSRLVKDAKLRELAEGENESMAYAFPSSPSGFTKSRVEYNKPLLLDLRTLAQHLDKVLLFSHMQGAVTDVRRLLTQKDVSRALDRIDPGAYEGMLIPWLNRSAKQIVETPIVGDRKLSRFMSAARSRAGMALMMGNISNTLQQITGFSMAAVKVKPSLMLKATGEFTRSPKTMKESVAESSVFMKNRMLNEVAAMNNVVEEILVNPSKLDIAQAWTQKHAYFMQSAIDNTMSPIIWTAAYNQAVEQGQDHKDAVRFADGTVRQTQGTTLPEDISRFESGPATARIFTQFIGYFNMMANTNATAMKQIADEMGLKRGAGKLLYVALVGLMVPIWVAESIALAFRGGPDDEDDDGYIDDWLAAVFGVGTLRGLTAQVPIVGQGAQLIANRFNDNPADDKFSMSPAVSLIESAVSAPASVYKAIIDDGSIQKAVRDVAAAATMLTGLPFYAAARPVGYAAGVAQGKTEPTSEADLVRGLATGTPSKESKQ